MNSASTVRRLLTTAGLLAVLAVLLGLLGTVASLVADNGLLTGSPWRLAALATAVVVGASVALFALAGKPSGRWRRTPYW